MKKKRKNVISVSFIGENAHDVTGSMTLIKFNDKNILLEAGLFQGLSVDKDFEINSKQFKEFKPKEIDYVFIGHIHADHSLLIPRLFKEGFRGKVIMPGHGKELLETMAKDSAFIIAKDATYLSKQKGKKIEPIYTEDHVSLMIENTLEFQMNQENQLTEDLSFTFIPSGHIINAAQIILKIKIGNLTKKILYTSDLGNIAIPKLYAEPFSEAKGHFDLVIGESTYGREDKYIKKKDREKELDKLKRIILHTINEKGKVLIPIFSLDRAQHVATELYTVFKNDPEFKTKVLIDSPLACKISSLYLKLLPDETRTIWQEVMNWENLYLIRDYESSEAARKNEEPMIILSAPGFITKGRSLEWVKTLIEDKRNCIITCGYFPKDSILYKIKNGTVSKIKINNKFYKNNIPCHSLLSFSSHMQKRNLINYYSKLDTPSLVLVHGSQESKNALKEDLDKIIYEQAKNMTIYSSHKNMSLLIK